MRRPENSPGSPAQCPAVSTSFGAMMVPEQRNAGFPAMSMMMRTTAGWAFPSSVPSVMNDGRPGLRSAVGTRSQPSRPTQAAARTGMTRRAFMVPLAGGMGLAIVTRNERLGQIAATAWPLRDVGPKQAHDALSGSPRSLPPGIVHRSDRPTRNPLTAMLTDTTVTVGPLRWCSGGSRGWAVPDRPAADGALTSP